MMGGWVAVIRLDRWEALGRKHIDFTWQPDRQAWQTQLERSL